MMVTTNKGISHDNTVAVLAGVEFLVVVTPSSMEVTKDVSMKSE
jgi:hypothetical protein